MRRNPMRRYAAAIACGALVSPVALLPGRSDASAVSARWAQQPRAARDARRQSIPRSIGSLMGHHGVYWSRLAGNKVPDRAFTSPHKTGVHVASKRKGWSVWRS
jgi:hypothetical protein